MFHIKSSSFLLYGDNSVNQLLNDLDRNYNGFNVYPDPYYAELIEEMNDMLGLKESVDVVYVSKAAGFDQEDVDEEFSYDHKGILETIKRNVSLANESLGDKVMDLIEDEYPDLINETNNVKLSIAFEDKI